MFVLYVVLSVLAVRDRLLSLAEAAFHLGIRPKTLRNWRRRGFGPVGMKFGRSQASRVYYYQSTLDAWLAEQIESPDCDDRP